MLQSPSKPKKIVLSVGALRQEFPMMSMEVQPEVDTRDDFALVHYAKRGDVEAFEELIRRHTQMILRVAAHITNSREDAEDVAQEAFLKAYQNLQFFEERSRFSTWLTRTAMIRENGANLGEVPPQTFVFYHLARAVIAAFSERNYYAGLVSPIAALPEDVIDGNTTPWGLLS
jgi:hypothetical protein